MKINNLSLENSLLNNFISEIRDESIQNDALRFRRNIERVGKIMALELSKVLKYRQTDVKTPLGFASVNVIEEKLVVASILRAGLPLHYGFLSMFDHAENAFVSAYRKYCDATNFDIHVEYISAPNLNGKTLIICDPMLATGGSMEMSYKALLSHGMPDNLHVVSIIASTQALNYLAGKLPENTIIWTAAVDEHLNEHAYIVPGIGDAGDLCFGEKLDLA
ncbi:MAG: uracil phosphoribosyltransferase [Prevotellaceae bacterium]|jgi:uracil phosphoribosyltransferase|nr:uracil phosphoribosyltransferase [Prevotellaceae bacterium]